MASHTYRYDGNVSRANGTKSFLAFDANGVKRVVNQGDVILLDDIDAGALSSIFILTIAATPEGSRRHTRPLYYTERSEPELDDLLVLESDGAWQEKSIDDIPLPETTVPITDAPQVEVTPNGVWTAWHQPHARCFAGGGRRAMLMGTVNNMNIAQFTEYDLDTKANITVPFFDLLPEAPVVDDHNSPVFIVRKDGYIEGYVSAHSGDLMHSAVSISPWTIADGFTNYQTTWVPNPAGTHGYSYFWPWQLTTWNLDVATFRGGTFMPTVAWRTSAPEAGPGGGYGPWTGGYRYFLTTEERPYVRTWSNGRDRIDLFMSKGNPEEVATGGNDLYHCYIQGATWDTANVYKSDGTLIRTWKSVVGTQAGAVFGGGRTPLDPAELTLVYDASVEGGTGSQNGGVMNIAQDPSGRVACTYMVKHTAWQGDYWYARLLDGVWVKNRMAQWIGSIFSFLGPGGDQTESHPIYTPEAAVSHENVDVVYVGMPEQPEERENLIATPFEADNFGSDALPVGNTVVQPNFTGVATAWQAVVQGTGTTSFNSRQSMPAGSADGRWNPGGAANFGWKIDYTKDATGTQRSIGMKNIASTAQRAPVTPGLWTAVHDVYLDTGAGIPADLTLRVDCQFFDEAGVAVGGVVNGSQRDLHTYWNRLTQEFTVPAGATRAELTYIYITSVNAGHFVGWFYTMRFVPGRAAPIGWIDDLSQVRNAGLNMSKALDSSWGNLSGTDAFDSASKPPDITGDEPMRVVHWQKTTGTDTQRFGIINENTVAAKQRVRTGERYTFACYLFLDDSTSLPLPSDLSFACTVAGITDLDGSASSASVNGSLAPVYNQFGWHRYATSWDVTAGVDGADEVLLRLNMEFTTASSASTFRAFIIRPMILRGDWMQAAAIERWTTTDYGNRWPFKEIRHSARDGFGKKWRGSMPQNRFVDAPEFVYLTAQDKNYDSYAEFGQVQARASLSEQDGNQIRFIAPTDSGTGWAPLVSPTFTGDPKAPTPAPGDSDTSIATTGFVTTAVASVAAAGGTGLYVSVKQAPYSATGNGTTDDSAAVQAAVDAVSAAGGGTVYFPRGTYLLNSSITMKSNVTCIGDGRKSVLQQGPGSTVRGVFQNAHLGLDLVNLGFEKLCLKGDPTQKAAVTTAGAALQAGINILQSIDNIRIRDCYFYDFSGSAIYCRQVTKAWISGNYIENCCTTAATNAIDMEVISTPIGPDNPALFDGIFIQNNYVVTCPTLCINILDQGTGGRPRSVVIGNYVRASTYGIGIESNGNNRENIVSGNQVIDCNTGILVQNTGGTVTDPLAVKNNIVTGNVIDSQAKTGTVGIITDSSHSIFANNVIRAGLCIYVQGFSTRKPLSLTIAGNDLTCYTTGTYGILAEYMVDSMVGQNTIHNEVTSAGAGRMRLANCEGCTVRGNILHQPGGLGIHIMASVDTDVAGNTIWDPNENSQTGPNASGIYVGDGTIGNTKIHDNTIHDRRGTTRTTYGVVASGHTGTMYSWSNLVIGATTRVQNGTAPTLA